MRIKPNDMRNLAYGQVLHSAWVGSLLHVYQGWIPLIRLRSKRQCVLHQSELQYTVTYIWSCWAA